MSGLDYTLEDLIHSIEHHLHDEIHTLMPGKIVTYYPATQTADVQPMVKRVTWSDTETDGVDPGNKVYSSYPLIPNVPVEFPGAGGFVLTFPVHAGDSCDIEFSEASMADYLSSGQESAQSDVGRHKLAHAVVHPVYCPVTSLSDGAITGNDRMVLGTPGGVQMQITGGNIILGAGATDFAALSSKVDAALSKLQDAFDHHTHATAGAGTPSPPVALPAFPSAPIPVGSLASTAASVTKVK